MRFSRMQLTSQMTTPQSFMCMTRTGREEVTVLFEWISVLGNGSFLLVVKTQTMMHANGRAKRATWISLRSQHAQTPQFPLVTAQKP